MANYDNFQSLFIQIQQLRPTSLSYEVHTLPVDKLELGSMSTRAVQGCYTLVLDGSSVAPEPRWHDLKCEIILTDLGSYLVEPGPDGNTRIGSLALEGDWGVKGMIQVKPAIMRDLLDYFRFPLVLDADGERDGAIVLRLDMSTETEEDISGERYQIYRLALEDN